MTVPDQLTLARALAVPIVVVLFAWNFPDHAYWATAVFVVAMATDQVDGWLARSEWTQGTFLCSLPVLTTAIRLDIHFYWNTLEVILLIPAAVVFLGRTR